MRASRIHSGKRKLVSQQGWEPSGVSTGDYTLLEPADRERL